jgi:endonuclease YncB( thermonuclease family)
MNRKQSNMLTSVSRLRVGRLFLSAILLFNSGALVFAETLTGAVIKVADGDTLTILDATKAQHRIRLGGIDAPEKKQAFGNRAKQALSAAAYGKQVTVVTHKKDRYGRYVGTVLFAGKDLGLELVHQGLAWHYKAYELEQPPEERDAYAAAEIRARKLQRGLWIDTAPIPPWDFRRMKKQSRG